ncbi:hypothetical protein [Bacillus sp. ISL-46]|uniref:hypothetical protein n=1 Tax=Bacillus sp. ISL-46 TaxID=2819129 RepID=UPI001BE6372D|nr:hypothetical protein [Bacillus sp. ISL-46]MBT2722278.1 hypothetical protein [Bacillus sp. ISL-46]
MNGLYLASNIGPIKTLGEGEVFITVNDLLNTDRFKNVEMVAYRITGNDDRIATVECLFKRTERRTLFFREFNFYKSTKNVSDHLKLTAEHGIGIGEFEIDSYLELRDFYLQHTEVKA